MPVLQQDQFIDDDEEETCPLCVEEFDLGDKGFRPCPCGYQICQFCYNNVKNNMNGLCPACRRPYNDNDIEWKPITSEEEKAHKARQAAKQKKTQAALQKEKQKAEADHLSRKHLAGMRVLQRNLVYVTGLSPNMPEDKLLATLRGDLYFGQYGKIIKIVVSKAKDPAHPHSIGVYVTFERKEDAANCIAAVNGSANEGRILRAQYGTTKYCSAYLRGENCSNRNCMFLHEPGEASESYSRADLSALNAGSSQHGIGRAPPPQSQQPIASASQPMARQSSDQSHSPSADRPALPSTASWASKAPHVQPTRTESRSTSGTVESPVPISATPAPSQPEQTEQHDEPASTAEEPSSPEPVVPPMPRQERLRRPREAASLFSLVKNLDPSSFNFVISLTSIPEADLDFVNNYPPLFDKNGGAKRKLRRQREEEQRRMEQEAQAFQQPPAVEQEENPEMSGSLQLGGEPEERQTLSQPQSAIQPPGPDGMLDQRYQFGGISSPNNVDRGLTPQQHQQLLLQTMKAPNAQGSFTMGPQSSFSQPSHPPGHQRNASRYSFANETSASTAVKPVANPKLLSQQSSIMPQATGNHFGAQHQPHGTQFYTSNVQGPPPGLKTTGTPPVSGGMTFGQGHGFTTGGLQYGANVGSRNANEEMMRNLLRGRDTSGSIGAGGAAADAAKRDAEFPPLAPPSRQQSVDLRQGNLRQSTPPVPPGFEHHAAAAGASSSESRRSTPTIPPGLSKPTAVPADLQEGSGSRPSSRASLKRTVSITPAVPLRPATPEKPRTPSAIAATAPSSSLKEATSAEIETPTKAPKGAATVPSAIAKGKETAKVDIPETPMKEAGLEGSTSKTEQELAAPEDKTEAVKSTTAVSPSPKRSAPQGIQPASKGQATVQASDAKAAPVTPSKPSSTETPKRKHPGKLDITAAVAKPEQNATSATPTESIASTKTGQRSVAQTPSATSKPESPSGSISSPAIRTAPKTLRVVSTVKPESPSVSTPRDVTAPSATKLPSRQPSVASMNVPGTPSSEQVSISDAISMTSTSQSRANSPPPSATGSGKAGAAPTRPKTKNQLKKERQERAKAIEEENKKTEDPVKATEEEPAQEAIVSRKKKTKKEKEPKPKAKTTAAAATTVVDDSTPTASRPASPHPKEEVKVSTEPERAAKEKIPSKPSTPTRTVPPPSQAPLHSMPPPQMEPSPPPTPTVSAAEILADLKKVAPDIQKCIDSLFRSPATANATHFKPSQPITAKDIANANANPVRAFGLPGVGGPGGDFKLNLSKEEVESLLKGTVPALRYGGQDGRVWDREMITPTGAHLRALTEELEMRFLELEKAIRELPEELRFRPSKPQNETKFPHIDLEALKRQFENLGGSGRGVSVMEQMVQDGSSLKKGAFLVDEAGKYINEFVMPPATPPPSAGGSVGKGRVEASFAAATGSGFAFGSSGPAGGQGGAGVGVGPGGAEMAVPSVEIAERQLNESRKAAEERDGALRKAMKKNRKALGLG